MPRGVRFRNGGYECGFSLLIETSLLNQVHPGSTETDGPALAAASPNSPQAPSFNYPTATKPGGRPGKYAQSARLRHSSSYPGSIRSNGKCFRPRRDGTL